MREIKGNDQRNNIEVNGLNAFRQCFSTSNWMRMSFYSDDIDATDDPGLAEYLKYAELIVTPGWQHPSLLFDVQRKCVTKWLNDRGVFGEDIFILDFPIVNLPEALKDYPITISTHKIGGLPDGHIILLVDWDKNSRSFLVNDPFGDARDGYHTRTGTGILYSYDWLYPFIGEGSEFCRILRWNQL